MKNVVWSSGYGSGDSNPTDIGSNPIAIQKSSHKVYLLPVIDTL